MQSSGSPIVSASNEVHGSWIVGFSVVVVVGGGVGAVGIVGVGEGDAVEPPVGAVGIVLGVLFVVGVEGEEAVEPPVTDPPSFGHSSASIQALFSLL